MSAGELIGWSAVKLVEHLRRGEVSPLDCLDAVEARIDDVDRAVNALPIRCFERARDHARALMKKPAAERGLLAGLPLPIKDLTDVAGVRSTRGSLIFKDTVAAKSDILVQRIEQAGAVIYAKSNTPEFGAGANTFNDVFGATLNPYDMSKSAAGSSGGAAVALATGMAWLAHGSDNAGSLRTPASFCNIVGLRPTPGRVATGHPLTIDPTLMTQGPMARTVEDIALLLDAMSGDDPRDMISKPREAVGYLERVRAPRRPLRVAWSRDLGLTPVDPQVAAITQKAARRFVEAGVAVEEVCPDFSGTHDSYQALRAHGFAVSQIKNLEAHRDKMKPEVIWNIEEGLKLTATDLVRAEHGRAAVANRVAAFFETYDLLLCPTAIVPPFPIEERYVKSCDGVSFDSYIGWLAMAYAATTAGCPALSLPCGFTSDGLPIGLQIIGPSNGEAKVLMGAKILEDILALNTVAPIDPRPPKAA